MFCPECQFEYREGFTRCPQCDCDLVQELIPPGQAGSQHNSQDRFSERYVVLIENTNDNEALYLIPLLESFGILTRKVYTGASEVLKLYTGGVPFGLNILVPESKLDEARELLHAQIDWDEVNNADAN